MGLENSHAFVLQRLTRANRYNSLPVMFANLDHDLLAEAKAGSVAEKTYSFQKKETQFVPIGAKTGVAAFNGWSVR